MKNDNSYLDYDVSLEQKRIYFFQKLNGSNTIYNMPSIVRLEEKIDLNRAQNAIKIITDRQESLRTSFFMLNEKLIQRVYSKVEPIIKIYELCKKNSVSEIVEDFVNPFDLNKAPLFRVAFIIGDECDYIILDFHHIISDGTSEKIFFNEFNILISGEELPEIKMQYHDYVDYQKQVKSSKRFEVAKKFWIEKFKCPLQTLSLPTDFPRPTLQSFNGSKELFEVDKKTTALVRSYCQKNKVFINQFLLSALITALHKITEQEDIVVGVPVSTRRTVNQNSIIGVFINTLLIRAFPEKNKTFSQLFDEVSRYFLSAVLYQDYSIDQLAQDISFPKDLSRNPLFDVTFVYNSDITLDQKSSAQFYSTKSSKSDLTFEITGYSDKLSFLVEYCTDLFTSQTCRRFGDIYINVIRHIVSFPGIFLSEIPRISESEKQKMLFEWNNTNRTYNECETVNDLLSKQFCGNEKNALIFGKMMMSYKQLKKRVDSFAQFLRGKGIGRESIVAVMMDPSIDMITVILGIIKAGGAYLPIDKNTPKKRVDFILNDSNAKMIISDESIRSDTLVFSDIELSKKCCEIKNINKPEDLLYVIYTSGSTGVPKGVMVKNENVCNFLYAMMDSIHMHEHKRILLLTTVCFDISVLEMILPLMLGMEIVIASKNIQNNMRSILECIKENRIDILQFTPSRFNMISMFENWNLYFDSVKTILIGGESFPENLLAKLKVLKDVDVFNMYGPTETTIWSTFAKIDLNQKKITIGKPINNTQIYILNENLECVLPYETGTIFIGGYGVTRGYVNQPNLTSEKFIRNPFTNEIMYDTGDLGSWDNDGNIICLGRKDFQIKIRGYRIETGEIESVLESISGVDCAVVDCAENEGQKFLCAYFTGSEIPETSLRNKLRGYLPEYMIPSYFERIESIPLNANGKVDRKKLVPKQKDNLVFTSGEDICEIASTELEKQIEEVWKKVLNREAIDVNDDFFDIGGNSILAIQSDVMFEQLNLPIKGYTIYQFRTIRKIANHISNETMPEENFKKNNNEDIIYDSGSVIINEMEPYNGLFFESCYYNSLFSILKSYDVNIKELVEYYSMDYVLSNHNNSLLITADGDWQYDIGKLIKQFGIEYVAEERCPEIVTVIKESINKGFPVVLWIDCYYQSYRTDKYNKEHFPHTLTVYGFNEEKQCFYIFEQKKEDDLIYKKISIPFVELEQCYNGFLKYFKDFKKNDGKTFYRFMKLNKSELLDIPESKNEYNWDNRKLKDFFDYFSSVDTDSVNSDYLYDLIDGINMIINCLRIEEKKTDSSEKINVIQSKLELWEKLRANMAKCYFRSMYSNDNHLSILELLSKIAVLEGIDLDL